MRANLLPGDQRLLSTDTRLQHFPSSRVRFLENSDPSVENLLSYQGWLHSDWEHSAASTENVSLTRERPTRECQSAEGNQSTPPDRLCWSTFILRKWEVSAHETNRARSWLWISMLSPDSSSQPVPKVTLTYLWARATAYDYKCRIVCRCWPWDSKFCVSRSFYLGRDLVTEKKEGLTAFFIPMNCQCFVQGQRK